MTPAESPYALVLHYRNAALTADCLRSLVADGVTAVVIVDNSGDGGASMRALQSALGDWQASGVALQLETPVHNLGFSAGINLGLRAGGTRFGQRPALIINNDARLAPGTVEALMRTLQAQAGPAVIAAGIEGEASLGGRAHYQRLFGLITARALPGSFAYLSGCCLLVPATLAAGPLFDEAFFFYGDDIELGWRLRRRGIACVLSTDTRIEHRGSASSRNGSYFYEYQLVRSHWLLAQRLAQGRIDYAGLIAGRLLSLPLRALLRSARQRSSLPLRALHAATRDVLLRRPGDVRPGDQPP